jgi:hypothetical protein
MRTQTLDRVTAVCPCGAEIVFSNFRAVRESVTLRDRCPECHRLLNLRVIVAVARPDR